MVGALQLLGAKLISRFVEKCRVDPSTLSLVVMPIQVREIEVLKQLTWFYVINRSSLAGVQHGQRSVIRYLFDTFASALDMGNKLVRREVLPPLAALSVLDEPLDTKEKIARAAADAICSLTDSQAVACYCRLSGSNPGTIFDLLVEGGH